jgi:hypothetical protein
VYGFNIVQLTQQLGAVAAATPLTQIESPFPNENKPELHAYFPTVRSRDPAREGIITIYWKRGGREKGMKGGRKEGRKEVREENKGRKEGR